jgi:predicted AlkP superfamily phosphohydrolase/phosphomutase
MRTLTTLSARGAFVMILLASLACRGDGPPGRVLLIGIDGAAPRVVEDLLERGELPNLAQIAASGARGRLRSQLPLASPRIWNSVATGQTPEKHGIVDFAVEETPGLQRLFLSTDRRSRPLWTIASAAGLRVAVINWWNTYPPERVKGVIVSDHLFAREIEGRKALSGGLVVGAGPMIHPDSLETELAAALADKAPPVAFGDPFAEAALPSWVPAERLSQWYQQDGIVTRIALEVEEQEQPDLMMVLLTGIDRVSHMLWGSLEPPELYPESLRFSGEARDAAASAIESYYQYTDALIGRLLEAYDEEDLIFVVSDHGFEAGASLGWLTGIHETEAALHGVVFARGRGIPKGIRVHRTTIFDLAPTVLAWLGLPVAADMDGRVVPFLRDVEPEWIDSYDHLPVEHLDSSASGAESELMDQLRALGYLE